jgi:hypothetical protein
MVSSSHPVQGTFAGRLFIIAARLCHYPLSSTFAEGIQYIGAPRAALESYLEGLYFLPKESGGEGNNTRNSEIEPLIRAYRERVEGLLGTATPTLLSRRAVGCS